MIITYPIRIPYTKGTEQRVLPDEAYRLSETQSGIYPVGKNRFWHGGVHMHPASTEPIRAIADGVVVAYRFDERDVTDEYFVEVPYSRSFVLLRHEAELGVTDGVTSKVTFYSLYMHLQPWGLAKKARPNSVDFLKKMVPPEPKLGKNGSPLLDKNNQPIMTKPRLEQVDPIADGNCHAGAEYASVQRGDVLGFPGVIPDNLSSPSTGIHFEIFFDDAGFLDNSSHALWGRIRLKSTLKVRAELIVKESLSVDVSKPLPVDKNALSGKYRKITVGKISYWVAAENLRLVAGPMDSKKKPGDIATQQRYFPITDSLEGYRKNPEANERVLDTGTELIPWTSPWFRKGEYREETCDDGLIWIQVYLPIENEIYWAEKNSVEVTSDADWPGFVRLAEAGEYSQDGFVDDAGLNQLVSLYNQSLSEKSAQTSTVRDKLRHVIVKHPSEWSGQKISERFKRVTSDDFGASRLTADQFVKLKRHIERLAFWDEVVGLPSYDQIWHAHPIAFIEQLAKSLWLSKSELSRIYPAKSGSGDSISHGTSDEIREKYRIEINKCCLRYGINTRLRQVHFFAQGAVESTSLTQMIENDTGTKYEGKAGLGNIRPGDGPRFKGLGFKQLTGRYNFAEYWVYRGWLKKGIDFDVGWEHNLSKRYPEIDNPLRLVDDDYTAIDAGAWYIARFRPRTLAAMDSDDVENVTRAINGGVNGLPDRTAFTARIRRIML